MSYSKTCTPVSLLGNRGGGDITKKGQKPEKKMI